MTKHWKSYLPQNNDSKNTEPDILPKSLAEAADLSESLKGLLSEREKLEKEIESLSGAKQHDTGRFAQSEIISIDQKKKLEQKWDKTRKKGKKTFGLKTELKSKIFNRKTDLELDNLKRKPKTQTITNSKKSKKNKEERSKSVNKNKHFNIDSPFRRKKAKSKITLDNDAKKNKRRTISSLNQKLDKAKKTNAKLNKFKNEIDKKSKKAKSVVSEFSNAMDTVQKFSRVNNLDIEVLDKISDNTEKLQNTFSNLEKIYNNNKQKADPILKYAKKVDDFVKNDLAKSKDTSSNKKKEGFTLDVNTVKKVAGGIKKANKIKEDWMQIRDQKRTTSKSKSGLTV